MKPFMGALALALVATSAIVGRELNVNGTRERAARIATTRFEILRATCRSAVSGRETLGGIESDWSVALSDSSHLSATESVTYPGRQGPRTDVYRGTLHCAP